MEQIQISLKCFFMLLLDFVWLKIWAGKEGCWFDHDKCASCPLYILWVLLNVMCILPFQCLDTFLLLVLRLYKQLDLFLIFSHKTHIEKLPALFFFSYGTSLHFILNRFALFER